MAQVSVIVPVHGAERTLAACLDSVCAQQACELEVLCVDDGALDASGQILDAFAAKDSRIRICHQPNRGVALARNRAMALAKGRFLAFIDPDDLYPSSEALARLYSEAVRSGVPIVGGVLERLAPDTGSVSRPPLANTELPGVHAYRQAPFDHGYTRFIYDRAWLLDHGICFPPYVRFQDPPFLVRAMATAGTYAMIEASVYRYRDDPGHVRWAEQDFVHLRHLFLGMGEVARLAREYGLPTLIARLRQRLLVEWWLMLKPYHAIILVLPEFDTFLRMLPKGEAERIRRAFAHSPRFALLERCQVMLRKIALVRRLCGWSGLFRMSRDWVRRRIGRFR